MKPSIVMLLLLTPITAIAQDYPGMSQIDMQKLQKMQTCMKQVDQKQLKEIEQRQEKFDSEVTSLCGGGKRDEAQKKAVLFEKEMANNPAFKAIQKCGEIAKETSFEMPSTSQDENDTGQHVCDSYQ